jgi:hypothetical protein
MDRRFFSSPKGADRFGTDATTYSVATGYSFLETKVAGVLS